MRNNNEGLRWGISTGTCAAAAAKASAMWARDGLPPPTVSVALPTGEALTFDVLTFEDGRCGIIKDAGDDLDATNGVTVTARVTVGECDGSIRFAAGEGVGTVTLPGLKIPPGEPAINPVPRSMIEQAVREIAGAKAAVVEVAVPGGEQLAARTFNKRLGIEGGLSILGTTGRVRPMDKNALFESLSLELSTHAARGRKAVALTFASTGEKALEKAWNVLQGLTVQVANELGYALDECARLGLDTVLVAGHPGKMLKVAAGGFDTHNRVADGRFEALCAHAGMLGAAPAFLKEIYACRTTEEAMALLCERLSEEERRDLWNALAARAAVRCADRMFGALTAACAFLDNDGAVLGQSENVPALLDQLDRLVKFDQEERTVSP